MQKHVVEEGINFTQSRRLLLSGMAVKDALFSTGLLKWYMDNGLDIYGIVEVIEYQSTKVFEPFVKLVATMRQEVSKKPHTRILADMYKNLSNSSFGSMIMNRLKHQRVHIARNIIEASTLANEKTFKSLQALGYGMFEVESTPKRVCFDLPVSVGYQILQTSKIRLLELKYNFLDKYAVPEYYSIVLCDTDSLYISMCRKTLQQIVKPELLEKFIKLHNGQCGKKESQGTLLCRTCCEDCAFRDSKTPGLYKEEVKCDQIIAMASKTYVCKSISDNAIKLSAKGCNKLRMLAKDPYSLFEKVLKTHQPANTLNRGFRMHQSAMHTYVQKKTAVTFAYYKRIVLEAGGGIYTVPLKVILQPVPPKFLCLQTDCKPLSIDFSDILFTDQEGMRFLTIRQAYVYKMICHHLPENDMLQTNVLRSRDAAQLVKIQRQINEDSEWEQIRYDVISSLINQRFEQNVPQLQNYLLMEKNEEKLPFANACEFDTYLGMGISPKELRWRPDYDEGRNVVGEIYNRLRWSLYHA